MTPRLNPRGLLACALLLVGCVGAWAADAKPASAGGFRPLLVSEYPCPDPQVFHDGADWYVFGTGARPFFLQGRELGPGRMRRVELDIDYAGFARPVHQVWGLIVDREADGRCHAYGTLHLGDYRTVIAAFTPRGDVRWQPGKPVTRWRLASILVGDADRDDCGYYESKILREADGTRYLVYVARAGRDNQIVARRMRSATELDAAAPPRLLLRPSGYRSEDRNGPGGMQLVEGPSLARLGGKHVLLYSVGDFRLANYKLGMAFSETLLPPEGRTYRTAKVRVPDEEIAYLLQSEHPDRPNYVGDTVVGPGLGSVVEIDGRPWLFFHGYKPDDRDHNPENRFVFRVPLMVGIDGTEPRPGWLQAAGTK